MHHVLHATLIVSVYSFNVKMRASFFEPLNLVLQTLCVLLNKLHFLPRFKMGSLFLVQICAAMKNSTMRFKCVNVVQQCASSV